MPAEHLDDGAISAPASNGASAQNHARTSTTDDTGDTDVPPTSSPTKSRLETPEERLARKLAADSEASQSNADAASAAASAEIAASAASVGADTNADDSTSMFEAKAAATATALRKEESGRTTNSSGRRRSSQISQPSVESRPGAYRVRGSSGGFDDDDEEESKEEVEYVGSRAKLATDDAVLVGTKLAAMTNEGDDGEYTVVNNPTSRIRGFINSSLKSSTKSNKDVLIPEAFVVEDDEDIERGQDDSIAAVTIPMTTAEVVETKSVCGMSLPTHTWKMLAGAVLGVLALVAIIVGSLAGTGQIGGDKQVSSFGTDKERAVVLDCPATKLVAEDGAEEDKFGRAVAIDAGVAVVGAFFHSDKSHLEANITEGGAAYVYEKVEEEWTLVTKLLAPGAQLQSKFGVSVAAGRNGTLLALGADTHNNTLGAVFLFTKDEDAADGWIWSGRIDPPPEEGQVGDRFGDSVAIGSDGVTLAVGAGDRNTGGLVYLYTLSAPDSDGQITWQNNVVLRGNQVYKFSDKFGGYLAMRGDTLVVGAQKASEFDQASGAAYVYERRNGTWIYDSKLLPPESEAGYAYEFGNAVDVDASGETIVVGSWKSHADDGTIQALGAAYVFVKTNGAWTIQQRLRPKEETKEKRRFGSAAAISADGNTVFIGSIHHDNKAGAVFHFSRMGNIWSQTKMIVPPGLYKNHEFGNIISVDDASSTVLIGEVGDTDAGGAEAGAAWLIDMC